MAETWQGSINVFARMNEWTELVVENVFRILIKKVINLVHKYSYVWRVVGIWTMELEGRVPKTQTAKDKIALSFLGLESTL